jgi:MoxR-like ATPase
MASRTVIEPMLARSGGLRPGSRAVRPRRQALTNQGFRERFERMVTNISEVIKGKDDVIRLSLSALLANGHVLFEDFPGTGKTMLARAIAQTLNATTSRVQCTPDLLPGDITGSPVLDRRSGDFVFRPGPVFANVLLADEVNRATPKTQSALLEAMAERQVTVDGTTHNLPRPFLVLATENPVELAGTFALPEAQLDRFLFKLTLGYADRATEIQLVQDMGVGESIDRLGPVIEPEEVIEMIDWATGVKISDGVAGYIVDLVQATRSDPALQVGGSTRATQALVRASKVVAAAQGREDVIPDDVKNLAVPVLAHRLILTPDAILRDETIEGVIDRLITRIKVPLGVHAAAAPARKSVTAHSGDVTETSLAT